MNVLWRRRSYINIFTFAIFVILKFLAIVVYHSGKITAPSTSHLIPGSSMMTIPTSWDRPPPSLSPFFVSSPIGTQQLRRCLTALANQITKPAAVIVVDDESEAQYDGEMMNDVTANAGVRFILRRLPQNDRPAWARNEGIRRLIAIWTDALSREVAKAIRFDESSRQAAF
ncbi:hypothetical protein BC938DRAFT_473325 [Jimgerdemannia flammicorona]|uniref:Glycosyltransferase 2-like domain-containing protein n=1 Tax=Jimgerdemannia flammicorona TaxID=994334 RepID=A0A433Q464_9FUNG|nr:hypothetical protein BC938DRAFT_473325 [Jimgerdemannia flammicorona]